MSKMFNYEADHIHDMVHPDLLTDTTHYVSECKDILLTETVPCYPKLTDYEQEWIYFYKNNYQGGGIPVELEYQTLEFEQFATIHNAIPFNYKTAIFKGNTKYRDIDTRDILDTFDETKNLVLVSVKMPVLEIAGKNLCSGLEQGGITSSDGSLTNTSNRIRTKDFINIYAGSYYISTNKNYEWAYRLYDINGVFLNSATQWKQVGELKITENSKLKVVVRLNNDKNISPTNDIGLQIERGSGITTYEPPKSNILTTSSDLILGGIDDVYDTLDLLTGEVVENTKEIVLNGSENWISTGDTLSTVYRFYLNHSSLPQPSKPSGKLICKSLPIGSNVDYESICLGNSWGITISISKSKLNSYSPSELRSYLALNPITVRYQLDEKVIKTVDLNTIIKPYEGTNNYIVSSETIPPRVQLSVPVESTGTNTLNEINQEE